MTVTETRNRPPLQVSMFSGASSIPLIIADQLGLFNAAGLDVTIHLTRNSADLMQGMLDGRFDVVHATPDNFVAWRDRVGVDFLAWIGGTSGPMRLMTRPEITEIEQLKGQEVAVDSPTSGFVSVLWKILRSSGLEENQVSLVPLGSTQMRFEALVAGDTPATMLTLPFSALASRSGCNILADQHDVLPRLQGSCGASLSSWLSDHPGMVDSYLRGLCAAITWLNDPADHDDANAIVAEYYELSVEVADEVRSSIMDPRSGWIPSTMIDPEGFEMVCRLRTENGEPPASPPSTYYTLEPYRRVFGFELLT